jgi:hypothetical protein
MTSRFARPVSANRFANRVSSSFGGASNVETPRSAATESNASRTAADELVCGSIRKQAGDDDVFLATQETSGIRDDRLSIAQTRRGQDRDS